MSSVRFSTQIRRLIAQQRWDLLRELLAGPDAVAARAALVQALADAPPADGARVLTELRAADAAQALDELAPGIAAEIMAELPGDTREAVLRLLESADVAEIVGAMPSDEATDVLQDMDHEDAQEVISDLPPDLRQAVQDLFGYDETTAGGRMTTEAAAVRERLTAGRALEQLRREAADVENLNTVYVVDDQGRLRGIVSLRDLVLAHPDTPVRELTARHMHWAQTHLDQEELAHYMVAHDLDAVPIIDEDGALLGQVTLDDAAEVILEEATEDIVALSGVTGHEAIFSPFWASLRRRLPWLMLNVPMAALASTMVHIFTHAIERVPGVVAFLPLVGGIAGNASGQTVSVFVRGLALGEAKQSDVWRSVTRQAGLGAAMGFVLGVLVGSVESLWTRALILSVIGGAAVMANCMTACAFGALLPFTLRRIGFDPAMGANLVDTALTDATGYFYVLGFTTLALHLHWL
ncbi:MAG: magnesium transporter [Armatimonadota bacterium]